MAIDCAHTAFALCPSLSQMCLPITGLCSLYVHLSVLTNTICKTKRQVRLVESILNHLLKSKKRLPLILSALQAFRTVPSVVAADSRLIYFLCGCPFLNHCPLSKPSLLRSSTVTHSVSLLLSPLFFPYSLSPSHGESPALREALSFNLLDLERRKINFLSLCVTALVFVSG